VRTKKPLPNKGQGVNLRLVFCLVSIIPHIGPVKNLVSGTQIKYFP
jgi:hypothetical protein